MEFLTAEPEEPGQAILKLTSPSESKTIASPGP